MSSTIPLVDLRREYKEIHSEIDEAVARVVQRGWFVLGQEVEAFEEAWAAYCDVPHAVAVGSGTDALYLILRASGIGPGDEVVLPALASTYTALAVSMTGARPVFADVDGGYYTLDPAALEAAITPRTAAVVPAHLYGCPAEVGRIAEVAQRHGLLVVEEASHAPGARYEGRRVGGLADAAAFSFYPTLNLGAYGDAGAVTTADAGLAARIGKLRSGGRIYVEAKEMMGIRSRPDEIQAAVLRVKLAHLDAWNRQRRAIAARYEVALGGLEGLALPGVPAQAKAVYYLYVLRTPLRERLHDYLEGAGVRSGGQYSLPVYQQRAYAELGYRTGACPQAEKAAAETLSLPIFAQLSRAEVDQITRLVRFFFAMR
jgi:dTDP-3-amino-3,4,6-trideoxy-alpha-D-glucose transaminase